jgi:hypothetical protein
VLVSKRLINESDEKKFIRRVSGMAFFLGAKYR